MDPLDDLTIPLRVVTDEFGCAICFELIRECMTTPCGHNFCAKCILECLNRKHACPYCNKVIEKTQLIKNHHYDKLVSILNEEKEKASKAYFERLINQKHTVDTPIPAPKPSPAKSPVNNHKSENLSPIEAVFHRHLTKSLLSFEEYYNELKMKHGRNQENLKKSFASKMAEASKQKSATKLSQEELEKKLLEQLDALQKTFETSISLLVAAYEAHMTNLAPVNPWTLPVSVSLALPSRNLSFDGVIVQPQDTIKDVRTLLEKKLAEKGHAIKEYTKDNMFSLRRPFFSDGVTDGAVPETLLSDDTKSITQYKVEPGSVIVLKGDVVFEGDKPQQCITKWFVKGNNIVCDYFSCVECKLNWLCQECSVQCHKDRGHTIKSHVKEHKPTWACCYCATKCSGHRC